MISVSWPGLDAAVIALRTVAALFYGLGFTLAWIRYWRRDWRFAPIAAVWVLGFWALIAGAAWAGAHFVWPGSGLA
jgi:hypothetical protein